MSGFDDVIVAIHCITYNHEPYIRECLEGFVMQKTNFRFVAIVHDDASTDKTANIIREYEAKYPEIIKPIYETENQYSKRDGTIDRIMNDAIEATGAKYVAMCEGDDYWTDPLKLQRQVDFLDGHDDCSLIAENCIVSNLMLGTHNLFGESESKNYSFDDLLIQRRFGTASVMFPFSYYAGFCKLKGAHFDTLLWVYLSTKGKVYYEPNVSSVYRRGSGITESDKIKWAYTCESFNKSLVRNFRISKKIWETREENVIFCFEQAIKEAERNKVYHEIIKLSIRVFPYKCSRYLRNCKRMLKKFVEIR